MSPGSHVLRLADSSTSSRETNDLMSESDATASASAVVPASPSDKAPSDSFDAVLSVHDIEEQRKADCLEPFGKYEAKAFLLRQHMEEHGHHFAVFVDDNKKECKAMREAFGERTEFDPNNPARQVIVVQVHRPARGSSELPGLFNYPSTVAEIHAALNGGYIPPAH